MKNFLSERGITRSKQAGLAAFALLLTLAVVVVACSDALVNSGQDLSEQAIGEQDAMNAESGDAETFVVVEDMPELVGGLASIQEQLTYPQLAKDAGVEGRVIVQFVVDEEGSVVDPEVVRGVGSGLDHAALEAVRTAQFKPGKQRGEPVKVKMSLPVTFRLGDEAPPPPPRADAAGEPTLGARAPDESPPPPVPPLPESVIQIDIDSNNRLYVNGSRVSLGELESALQRNGLTSETIVSLRVGPDASTGTVDDVQTELRNTSVQRINYESDSDAQPDGVGGALQVE